MVYPHEIHPQKEYILNYGKPKIVTVLSCDSYGDCIVKFKNNKKGSYHYSLLEEKKHEK